MNQRLVILMRRCMSTYARRWRIMHKGDLNPVERAVAADYLARAIHCRERARQWEASPV
ncbi:MAG: hypothetical protein KGL39_40145 [Patescibacteria group bacterium]|nr:hypothetical protein [Patescibacteria group bacterium]